MHVVLDFNPVLRTRFSGFWTYGASLLEGLTVRGDVEAISLLAGRQSLAGSSDMPTWGHPKHRLRATRLRMRWWERWWGLCPRPGLENWFGPFDVYHSVHHLMPPTGGRPRVLTVHDLRRYRLGELYGHSRTDAFERAVAAADRIVAVSASTRDDLVELLDVPSDKIDVVHLATPPGFAPADDARRERIAGELRKMFGGQARPYAATISSRDRRKNLPLTVAAFAEARRRLGQDWRLVIIGQRPRGEELDRTLVDCGGDAFVHFTGLASPAHYADLLAGAEMFLFFSLYEGFGLPILEAMASGAPVLAGDNSSLPEVVGDDGVLVDASDPAAATEAIAAMASDAAMRADLRQRGQARAATFTPARLAEGTVACYRRATNA